MKAENATDQALLLALQSGDQQAFETLFERFSPRLLLFAKTFLPDEQEAQDVVQDCFMKLWERRSGLKNVAPRALLFTIVRNQCLNKLKHLSAVNIQKLSNTPTDALEELYSFDFLGHADSTLMLQELQSQIDQAVAQLPERTQEIFLLSRNEGLRNRDIAEQLGISMTAVEKHMNRAMDFLSEYFHDRYPMEIYLLVITMLFS